MSKLDWDLSVKANTHDAISCIKPLSNSLIRKLSLCFQHNSTKESYDTNRVVCIIGLEIWHLIHLNSNLVEIYDGGRKQKISALMIGGK